MAQPRRRRRGWIWLVVLVVVAGLVVAGWFAAEAIARQVVTDTIRERVIAELGLPTDQPVDVSVAGAVLPQVIVGRLDDVTVSSADVPLSDALTGDVTANVTGLQFRGDASAQSAAATVVLDTEQLRALMASVDGFPADTLGLSAPNVTSSIELSVFGARIPISIGLTPSAADGALVLTPERLGIGDAIVTADDLRSRFGGLADPVLRSWNVCIAQSLPTALTLRTVTVRGETLVADLAIDPAIISDPAASRPGTCP